jgi:L-alanine-DL-glutamate epimerase-like enolase superfamily enzyme
MNITYPSYGSPSMVVPTTISVTTMTQVVVEKSLLDGVLTLRLHRYVLKLRSAFGTSHSSTTTRINALIQIDLNNYRGYGEVGLPPKKKNCYLADFDDIHTYFKQFCENVEKELHTQSNSQNTASDFFTTHDGAYYSPFDDIPHPYFHLLRVERSQNITIENALPTILLKVLDTVRITESNSDQLPEYRLAAKCGIEMAVLDLWGSMLNKPLYSLVGIAPPTEKRSFYTASLNDDIAEIEKSLNFGLEFTDNIKIKLDHDVGKGLHIVQRLYEFYKKTREHNAYWSIDANSAWTPQISLEFLHRIKQQIPEFLPMLYMVEQPFPVDFLQQSSSEEWINVKQEYEKHNIFIFGDESVSTADHVPKIKSFVHGVNIKLEKAGGVRGALKAILAAKEHGLRVWLGSMVSSSLSCTCFAHLLGLSDIGGDLDGGLLVDDDSQILIGNFEWTAKDQPKGVIALQQKNGIGLIPK